MFKGAREERGSYGENGAQKVRPRLVFCAGGGAIGTAAARAALSQGMSVVVMDTSRDCLTARSGGVNATSLSEVDRELTGNIQLVIGDSVDGLLWMSGMRFPDIVVPAVGGHFAARVAVEFLSRKGVELVPCAPLLDKVVRRFPPDKLLSHDEPNAVLVASMMPMGKTCKMDCPQPQKCPVTGKTRDVPMSELIRSIAAEEADLSMTLAVGTLGDIGVIAGADLLDMFRRLEELGERDTFAVATSCKCHGIVNFLAPRPR